MTARAWKTRWLAGVVFAACLAIGLLAYGVAQNVSSHKAANSRPVDSFSVTFSHYGMPGEPRTDLSISSTGPVEWRHLPGNGSENRLSASLGPEAIQKIRKAILNLGTLDGEYDTITTAHDHLRITFVLGDGSQHITYALHGARPSEIVEFVTLVNGTLEAPLRLPLH